MTPHPGPDLVSVLLSWMQQLQSVGSAQLLAAGTIMRMVIPR